jgi:hypothetical protein
MLAGGAKLAGASLLGLAFVRPGTERALATDSGSLRDLELLNRLRGMEHLASALYRGALWQFDGDETTSGDRLRPDHPTLVKLGHQEQGHAAWLTLQIVARGGEAATLASSRSYDFGYEDFGGVLRLAAEVEAAMVAAYAEAVTTAEDRGLRRALANLLAVEARHSAYLNGLIGESPFPVGSEMSRSRADIDSFTAQFAER